MLNPWSELPSNSSRFVLQMDAEAVEAYQARNSRRKKYLFQLHVPPEPWCGPILNADVLLLASNPHWDERDESMPSFSRELMRRNLSGEEPLIWLQSEAEGLRGGEWYGKTLRRLVEDVGVSRVAHGVCLVDLVGYRSHEWDSKFSAPSQLFSFQQVRMAIERGAAIVVLRSVDEWCEAVPELKSYDRVMRNSSRQCASISPRNTRFNIDKSCEVNGYDQILQVLNSRRN